MEDIPANFPFHFAENLWPWTTGPSEDPAFVCDFPQTAQAWTSSVDAARYFISIQCTYIGFVSASLAVCLAGLRFRLTSPACACVLGVRVLCRFAQQFALETGLAGYRKVGLDIIPQHTLPAAALPFDAEDFSTLPADPAGEP